MIGKNKISGVVCEFNPLHNGHAALLSRISEEFGSDIVCVISGNFVQRGEAAVLDKWSRTRLAPTPTNLSTKPEPEMEKNGTPASPATALASRVLPVPGEPTSSAPRGSFAPMAVYLLGL